MRAILIGVAVTIAGAGCAIFGKPPPLYVFPVRHYELPSGLRVVIEEEQTSGMVGVAWVIDAGTLDDPSGAPGLAHLVEHLTLRAPDAGGAPLERRLAALGAETNAVTALDRTRFFTFVPSPSLDAAMALMAARLADPLRTVDEQLVAKERAVTVEEMRLRQGIGSMIGVRAVLAALASPGQPFARLGDFDGELRAKVTVSDARGFVERYYLPQRMTLVISGPVSPADDLRVLAALPSALRGREQERVFAVRRPLVAPSPAATPATPIPARTANVNAPELWMAWLLPPARGLAVVPFEVLGGVVDRFLHNGLNEGALPDVLAANCSTENSALGGALICRFALRPSADPAAVKQRAGALIADLGLLSGQYLPTRARNAATWSLRDTSLAFALAIEGLARRVFIRANLAHEDPSTPLSSVLESIQRITPVEVSNLAERHLREELARAVLLVPDSAAAQKGRSTPVVLARAEEAPRGAGVPAEDDAEVGDQDDPAPAGNLLDVARAPGAGAAMTTRLANGLTIIALRRPGLPFASMVLGFHAEPQPQDPPGIGLAAIYGRHHSNIETPSQRGVKQEVARSRDRYEETISMFSSQLSQGLELLDDEAQTLSVRWPAPAFDRWLEMATLASGTPAERAENAFAKTLWRGHPYFGRVSREQLHQITSDQILAWLNRVRRPVNGALVIVGDIDPSAVTQAAAESLTSWSADPTPPAPPPMPPPQMPRPTLPVLFTSNPEKQNVDIHFGCFLPPVRALNDQIAGDVFVELVREDLMRKLRYQLGASYDIRVGAEALRGGTYVLDGHVDAKVGALDPALGALRGWLEPTGPLPDEAALTRARWRLGRRSALGASTNASLARWLFTTWNAGLPLASLDAFPRDLVGITLADMTGVLASCRSSAVVSVLGPEPSVAPRP